MSTSSIELPDEAVFAAPQLRPVVRLSPFLPESLEKNREIARAADGEPIQWQAVQACRHREAVLTRSGRAAIRLALSSIGLQPDDEVLIVTTGMSPYISRCVTEEIERHCAWSQSVSARTRCVFVIHSFGFQASLPDEAASLDVPVIEDCAYGFGSASCGNLGDFVVYSFSKTFPLPFGGALFSRSASGPDPSLSAAGREHLARTLSYYLARRDEAFARRRTVFRELSSAFEAMSLEPYYVPGADEVPHAFVFRFPDEERAVRVRRHMDAAGIESSVYYGSGGYYVPCHQNMGIAHVDYIARQFAEALTSEAPS